MQCGIHFTLPSGNLCASVGAPKGAVTLMFIFVIYTEIDCGSYDVSLLKQGGGASC